MAYQSYTDNPWAYNRFPTQQTGPKEPNRKEYGIEPIDPKSLEGFNMLRQLITTGGPSQAAQYSMQQALQNRQDQIDAATAQQAGGLDQARSQLAMRGGLSTGASERLAAAGMENLMRAKQAAFRNQGNNMLDILKSDEMARRDLMSGFSQMEANLAKNKQDTAMNLYKMDIDKWAAGKQADATAKAGGDGK